MKKLKLDPDKLKVDSFDAVEKTGKSRGTVVGHWTLACTDQFACTWPDCGGGSMLEDSCGATCGGVCGPQTYARYGCTEM